MQLSLVSFYGAKPEGLKELILSVQDGLMRGLGESFHPYTLEQIHGTIVSLERVDQDGFINKNFARMRASRVEMDFDGLLAFCRETKLLPLKLQIGGFEDREYGFQSRQQNPYQRTFSIQGRFPSVLGWPVSEQGVTGPGQDFRVSTGLGELRKRLEEFNILHSYHRLETDFDNDFYFRVGTIADETLDPEHRMHLEKQMRAFLGRSVPLSLTLQLEDLFLVYYRDQRLPYDSSFSWPITDQAVRSDFIKTHYQNL